MDADGRHWRAVSREESLMLRALRIPVGWVELFKRTANEMMTDNCLSLAVSLAAFIVLSTALVIVGPALAEKVAEWFHLGIVFKWTWLVLQWPLVFGLVSLAIALVYYYAPDAEQDWIWITPGSIVATLLWLLVSLGFKFYVTNFGSYNATYGAIGGAIILLLWMYVSSLAILFGAEMNAEIEHASPYGKDPGEKAPAQKKKIGTLAEREWNERKEIGALEPAFAATNCPIDAELPAAAPAYARQPRPSDWVLSGLVLGEMA